jgi:rfaE bifunctional protein kinase chain/domain
MESIKEMNTKQQDITLYINTNQKDNDKVFQYFDKNFYNEIIDDFKEFLNFIKFKKILVVGDVMLDRWIKGEVERISPEAPVPVVKVFKEWVELGGAANVAKILSYYSRFIHLIGFVGNDIFFKNLISLLRKRRITYNLIKTNKTTIVKTRIIAHNNQHIVRVDREDTNYNFSDYSNLYSNLKSLNFSDFDIIFFIDYNKNLFNKETVEFFAKLFNDSLESKFIVVCPKPNNFKYFTTFNKIDFLSVNRKEASEIFSFSDFNFNVKFNSGLIIKFLKDIKLNKNLSIKDTVITLGSLGLSVFNKNYNIWIDSIKQEVFDVVGAGDNVASIYGIFKYYSKSVVKSAFLANLAGSIAVSKPFTNPVKPIDIFHSLEFLYKTNYKNKFLKLGINE